VRPASKLFAVVLACLTVTAQAADNTLLIRLQPDGKYKVWHIEGETNLADEELRALEASSRPEGGGRIQTSAGVASATDTAEGIVIAIPGAPRDKALLLDRDGCGALTAWHSEGATQLSDDQLTELVLSALPGGGKRIMLDGLSAKATLMRHGVMVVLWKAPVRRP